MDYSPRTRKRANRAVACSPFRLQFFRDLQCNSLNLRDIMRSSQTSHPYLHRSTSELRVEQSLLWLIQVGLLRREVDGQGITDRFLLTPLGHVLLLLWIRQGHLPRPRCRDRVLNALSRFAPWLGM